MKSKDKSNDSQCVTPKNYSLDLQDKTPGESFRSHHMTKIEHLNGSTVELRDKSHVLFSLENLNKKLKDEDNKILV